MIPEDEQQVLFALNQVIAFFGKELDDIQTQLWMRALRKQPFEMIKRALADYTELGKYAPKPRDILELVQGYKEEHRRTASLDHNPRHGDTIADPKVAKAWRYVISQWGGSGASMFSDPQLSPEEIDEAILMVNEQVKRSGRWDSIPPHLWLESVQGRPYPEEVA